MKTIIIGSDHAGFKLKEKLKTALAKNHDKIRVIDAGTNTEKSADYPDYAVKVGENVAAGADFGVLICGSGIGMSIAANKIPGVRAVLCRDELDAEMARKHNNANIICLGERRSSEDNALKIVEKFIDTEFEGDKEEGKRHKTRVAKFAEIEARFCRCHAKKTLNKRNIRCCQCMKKKCSLT